MTYEEGIYQVKRILEHSRPTDESRHNNQYLLDKIFYYRALIIAAENNKSLRFDTNWLSETGTLMSTEVYSGDVPEISSGSIMFSKFQLPTVIELRNGIGHYKLFNLSQNKQIYKLDNIMTLMNMIAVNDQRLNWYTFACIVGGDVYVYPSTPKMQALLVMENPLLGKVKQTNRILSGSIQSGQVYAVSSAQIIYNGVTYSPGDTFTGIVNVSTFTGNGHVYFNNKVRAVTYVDRLPISLNMFSDIISMMFKLEYGIEVKMNPDEINDSKPESMLAP